MLKIGDRVIIINPAEIYDGGQGEYVQCIGESAIVKRHHKPLMPGLAECIDVVLEDSSFPKERLCLTVDNVHLIDKAAS